MHGGDRLRGGDRGPQAAEASGPHIDGDPRELGRNETGPNADLIDRWPQPIAITRWIIMIAAHDGTALTPGSHADGSL